MNKNKYRLAIITAVVLIIITWTGVIDLVLLFSHTTHGVIRNPLDPNEELSMIVKHTSPTLAANTPAFIDVYIYLNDTYRFNNNVQYTDNAPNSFTLIFDDSDCGTAFRPGQDCIVTIPRVDDSHYAGNYYPIQYGRDGDYHITLAKSDSVFEKMKSTTENPVIHVNPTEATNEFRTFKMSIVIGIIAAAIAFIALFIQKDDSDSKRLTNMRRD